MTRHEMRECIFCLLFQSGFYTADEMEEQRDSFLEQRSLSGRDREEIVDKFERIRECLPEIDEKIAGCSEGWKLERIARAELAIMRLAVYEAQYDDNVPVGVAINEAVELAKEYGEESGSSFVNGILGKIVNE